MTETLFDGFEQETVRKHARISQDGQYRYSLHREWRQGNERPYWVTFVMLNPSTADANNDDSTIRRCIGFAKALGATGLAVVNLYAFRATQPADLWTADDPVGPENDAELETFLKMAAGHHFPVIAAWGANAKPDRVARLLQMRGSDRLQALGVTKDGAPRHPLYLPASAEMGAWWPR